MTSDLHETVADRLRTVEQRYTANRRELVTLLEGAGRPLTIAELLDRNPEIPQSSAYRNLTLLETAGIVVRLAGADEFARFELDEHLTEHHHHLICTKCGAVADFTLSHDEESALEAALDRATADARFIGADHRLDVMGTCSTCA